MNVPDVNFAVNVPELTALLGIGYKLVRASWRNHAVLKDLVARLERVEGIVLNGSHKRPTRTAR
jgi:hypothetical protein